MKNAFFALICATILCCSCSNNDVRISGKFLGLNAKDVYLEQMTASGQTIIDSVALATDGSYRFLVKNVPQTPSIYNIIYNNERIPLLLSAGESVTVSSLGSVLANYTVSGSKESELLRDFYREYMESGVDSYEEDRELWRKIYRYVIVDNDEIDSLLEDVNIYWNDDRFIIDTFVLKTINRFSAESNDDQSLLPEFRNDEDLEFARKLILQALNGADYYQSLIAQSTRNWDVERVPLMDRVIMQVALAEITSFPSIPLSVSLNEYIEIAKSYSTPNSARYINATLDGISKKLIAEHKLLKNA